MANCTICQNFEFVLDFMLIPINISKFGGLSFNKNYAQGKVKYGIFKNLGACNSQAYCNSEIHILD